MSLRNTARFVDLGSLLWNIVARGEKVWEWDDKLNRFKVVKDRGRVVT